MCKSFDVILKLLRANKINQILMTISSLARIKLKLGENEIEVDSRDFYVDNQTIGEVIDNISHHLPENHAKIVYETDFTTKSSGS